MLRASKCFYVDSYWLDHYIAFVVGVELDPPIVERVRLVHRLA